MKVPLTSILKLLGFFRSVLDISDSDQSETRVEIRLHVRQPLSCSVKAGEKCFGIHARPTWGDLPPYWSLVYNSFIMRVCRFDFDNHGFRFGQARRAWSPQTAQALGALTVASSSRAQPAVALLTHEFRCQYPTKAFGDEVFNGQSAALQAKNTLVVGPGHPHGMCITYVGLIILIGLWKQMVISGLRPIWMGLKCR